MALASPEPDGADVIAAKLKEVRSWIVTAYPPERYTPSEGVAMGRELAELRTVLARLHAVHTSAGRLTGWGLVVAPDLPPLPDERTPRAKSARTDAARKKSDETAPPADS